jgi:chromosome segregation ATPase
MNDQHIPVNRIDFNEAPKGAEGVMELSQRVDWLAARVDALTDLVKASHSEQLESHGELLKEQGERLKALDHVLRNHGEQIAALRKDMAVLIVKATVVEERLNALAGRVQSLEQELALLRAKVENVDRRTRRVEVAMWLLVVVNLVQLIPFLDRQFG